MKKIGLIGFTGDPFTIGHLEFIRRVLSYAEFDEVWIVLPKTYDGSKKPVDVHYRLDMLNILIKDEINDPRLKMSDIEIRRDKEISGRTFITLQMLREENPNDQFIFCMGSDNLEKIITWEDWNLGLNNETFCILERKGVQVPNNIEWYKNDRHIKLDGYIPETSSTQVRNAIKNKDETWKNIVPKCLHEYIIDNKLYSL